MPVLYIDAAHCLNHPSVITHYRIIRTNTPSPQALEPPPPTATNNSGPLAGKLFVCTQNMNFDIEAASKRIQEFEAEERSVAATMELIEYWRQFLIVVNSNVGGDLFENTPSLGSILQSSANSGNQMLQNVVFLIFLFMLANHLQPFCSLF